ncbi:MAG: hypothetical protein IPI67_24125 [Myxococcales bacterium]|nr:hypothetical protein [Myxococcales bacterium]
MKTRLVILMFGSISTLALVAACEKTTSAGPQQEAHAAEPHAADPAGATTYACPMHPEVTDTRPSSCSKCGMKLLPVKPKSQQEQ